MTYSVPEWRTYIESAWGSPEVRDTTWSKDLVGVLASLTKQYPTLSVRPLPAENESICLELSLFRDSATLFFNKPRDADYCPYTLTPGKLGGLDRPVVTGSNYKRIESLYYVNEWAAYAPTASLRLALHESKQSLMELRDSLLRNFPRYLRYYYTKAPKFYFLQWYTAEILRTAQEVTQVAGLPFVPLHQAFLSQILPGVGKSLSAEDSDERWFELASPILVANNQARILLDLMTRLSSMESTGNGESLEELGCLLLILSRA